VADAVRSVIPPLEEDRPISAEIETVAGMVRNGELLSAAERIVGPLL
jgi:histidine ammonia-lyase